MKLKTKEAQYNYLGNKKYKPKFGLMSGATWIDDPKRLLFHLSRYKFISKMIDSEDTVLEVGCADAFGSRIVAKQCAQIICSDFDQIFIKNAKKINKDIKNVKFLVHNFLNSPIKNEVKPTVCFCLDVLEHIPYKFEKIFLQNIKNSCKDNAVFFFGSPSQESQAYASKPSRLGHVNCKSGSRLREDLKKYFKRILLFSMNDEVLHTGFEKMAHYRIAICWN